MARRSCTIAITTFNRQADLHRTLLQLRRLDPPPNEIIICLDGCTDDSRAMMESGFPDCRVIANATRLGSVPSRDRMFRSAVSELVVSLDDDSYPLDRDFVQRISDLADRHPEAGAFTFPEIRDGGIPADPNMGPDSPARYVGAFPNCAGVMLRALYGTVAEYPVFFSHMYEEPDFCLQLHAGGYRVWFEPSLRIRHHVSAKERSVIERHHLNARNEMWSVLIRCPLPWLLPVSAFRLFRQFQFAVSKGWRWWRREPRWWWNALLGVPECLRQRKPVPWPAYLGWMKLARQPLRSDGTRVHSA